MEMNNMKWNNKKDIFNLNIKFSIINSSYYFSNPSPSTSTADPKTNEKMGKIPKISNTNQAEITLSNARSIFNSGDVEMPIEQVYRPFSTVGSLVLTDFKIDVYPFIPNSTANMGCFENLTVHEYCVELNCHVQNLLVFLISQLTIETVCRRYKVQSGSSRLYMNFNFKKNILTNMSDAMKSVCEGAPTTGVRQHLSRFGVATLHSQVQQFILSNIMKFNYTIRYDDSVQMEARVQPIWPELAKDAKIPVSGQVQPFAKDATIAEAMKSLKMDTETMDMVKSAFFLTVHMRNMDDVMNNAIASLKDSPNHEDQAPKVGIETRMLKLSPFTQCIIQTPNVISLKENFTMWSRLDRKQWDKKIACLEQVMSKFVEQKYCRSSKTQGIYLTKFTMETIRKQFDIIYDGFMAQAVIFFLEICPLSTSWYDLYTKQFVPHPIYDSKFPAKFDVYRHLQESGILLYSAQELRVVRVSPALCPSEKTLFARINNVCKTAVKLEEHQVISDIKSDQKKILKMVGDLSHKLKESISINKYMQRHNPELHAAAVTHVRQATTSPPLITIDPSPGTEEVKQEDSVQVASEGMKTTSKPVVTAEVSDTTPVLVTVPPTSSSTDQDNKPVTGTLPSPVVKQSSDACTQGRVVVRISNILQKAGIQKADSKIEDAVCPDVESEPSYDTYGPGYVSPKDSPEHSTAISEDSPGDSSDPGDEDYAPEENKDTVDTDDSE